MSTEWIILSSILCLAFACGLAFASRLLAYLPSRVSPPGQEHFDAEYYAAMRNLLSAEDEAEFQRSGASAKEIAKFRSERRELFRDYLRELAGDFHALHAQARRLAAVAPADQADLVGLLVRQQVRFWQSVVAIEFELAADHVGLHRVDPTRILGVVDQLGAAVARATATPGPVPV